jgi:hypothetical protein
LEQGRFGTLRNLPALIENWSLKIGHWQLNPSARAAQLPFTNFNDQFSIAFKKALPQAHPDYV